MRKSTPKTAQHQLLVAARHLFALSGYDATTTRSIVELAEANIALIKYHFGGKEGLFDAVLAAWMDGLCIAIDRDLSGVSDPADRTTGLVTAFLRYAILEAPGFAGLVARESVLAGPSPTTQRTATALKPVRELLDAVLPSCDSTVTDGAECLGLLLRLASPMPSIEVDTASAEGFTRARERALSILLPPVSPAEEAAPVPAPERSVYSRPVSPALDFVD